MFLIDSDVLISFCKGRTRLQERLVQAGLSQCVISEVSLAEMLVGAYKSERKTEFQEIQKLRELFSPIALSYDILDRYAKLRVLLEAQGNRLEDMDLFIAATALANDYTLVTHNTRHFSRIPGLKLEDWIEE